MMMIPTATTETFETIWQDYVPSIAWGTLLLGSLIGLGYWAVLSNAMGGALPYPVATIACTLLAYASFTVMHDAGHGSLIQNESGLKPIESVIGWLASIPLLIAPYRLFQKIHDRHHAFTNDPDRDPDHYQLTQSWGGIVLNSLFIPIQYHWLALTKLRHIPAIRKTYPSSALYFILTFGGLTALTWFGYGSEVLWFAVIPNILAVFILAMLFDFIPHHPHKSRDRFSDSRIYPGKVMNYLLLGQNYHLIHHMYPRLPWYKYQAVYRRILPDLEAKHAPIEGLTKGKRPGLLTSPNGLSLPDAGSRIHMVVPISAIQKVANDAVSIEFALPPGQRLAYQAGQYITVSKWLGGRQVTRCYSLCERPLGQTLKIAVRETTNGLLSTYLNRQAQVGDELVIQGPFGDFRYPSASTQPTQRLILIAGGSGITPLLSIIKTALAQSTPPSIELIYCNRRRESVMFFEQLERLKAAHKEQLTIHHVLNDQQPTNGAHHGRLNGSKLAALLPDLAGSEFFICGPDGLKTLTVDYLKDNQIADDHIHMETFINPLTKPKGKQHQVSIDLNGGQTHYFKVASNQTVLEVARANDIELPHACTLGTCGSCKLKLTRGTVEPIDDSIPGITSEEKAAGIVLSCQCKPLDDITLQES